jgi:hypothetical protein
MFSALRNRLHVSPATVIASLALIFAMTGGAYAAGRYMITSTKQIKPSVLAQLKGKAGPAGNAGAAGPAGAQGSQGPTGAKGENGANGAPGTSVTSTESKAKIGPCKEGGSAFAAGSTTTYACNGEKGKEGTFGGSTLPEGKTLTGVWTASGYGSEGFPEEGLGYASTGVSYALPLSVAPSNAEIHFIKEGETPPSECPGTAHAPAAAPGNLCVFVTNAINALRGGAYPGVHSVTSGFTLTAFSEAKGVVLLEGTWAVTAE